MVAKTAKKAVNGSSAVKNKGGASNQTNNDDDFIMTLDSDSEQEGQQNQNQSRTPSASPEAESQLEPKKSKASLKITQKIKEPLDMSGQTQSKKRKAKDDPEEQGLDIDKDFDFDIEGDGWGFDKVNKSQEWDMSVKGGKNGRPDLPKISVDDIIERRKKSRPEVRLPSPEQDEDADDESAAAGLSEGEDEEDELEFHGFNDDEEEELDSGDDEDAFGGGARKRASEAAAAEESDSEDEEDQEGDSDDVEEEAEDSESDSGKEDSDNDSEKETEVEKAKKAAYFATEESAASQNKDGKGKEGATATSTTSFQDLSLSRPLLRALATLNFSVPTPIQARTIPIALAGKDLVAGAVTGSGKTAAFMIPVLERLAHRSRAKGEAKTRVCVLTPTRELAIQCMGVGRAIAKFSDIRFCLLVGGLSVKSQEAELKQGPEVIICTPGRLIDHVRNSASFSLDDIEILIMDEADRMLEDGFAAELDEIVQSCPKARQTMLFSATMTDSVEQLVRLSLRRPVRLFVDPKRTTAAKLIQEFVRVRGIAALSDPGEGQSAEEGEQAGEKGQEKSLEKRGKKSRGRTEDEARPALLLSLCTRTFRHGVIIFVRSKALAHQLRIVFGLLGLAASELHGDLSQEQRLEALQSFRDAKTDFLIATDLASRGLDIRGVQTVINYDMPAQFEQYLHRVGRTARAGRNGRAVTLVGESDRKLLKTALKRSSSSQVRHRLIPADVVSAVAAQLDLLKPEVDSVLEEEKEEKAFRVAEMQIKKGENMIEHKDEIYSRPARTWFQSEKEKKAAKEISKAEYTAKVDTIRAREKLKEAEPKMRDRFAGLSRKQKRSRLAREEVEAEEAEEKGRSSKHEVNASIRAAKKAQKPKELGIIEPKRQSGGKEKKKKRKQEYDSKKRSSSGGKVAGKKSSFSKDLGERSGGGGGASKKKISKAKSKTRR